MGQKLINVLLLTGILLLSVTTASSANLIAYGAGSGNRPLVMVMEDTGTDPVEIYRGGKFEWIPDITISPPLDDGTWVALYSFGDLKKVPSTGGDPIPILCRFGTDIDGQPYSLMGWPQWSPDGSEILIVTENSLALIPADHEPGADCESELVPIWPVVWGFGSWALEGMPAWSSDGSRIAFFESNPQSEEFYLLRIVVLGRQEDDWTLERTLDANHVDISTTWPRDLDWQRAGDILAFGTALPGNRLSTPWISWINVQTGQQGYLAEGSNPTWSPDDESSPETASSHLVFTDPSGNLVKSAFPDGPRIALGAGENADWQRNVLDLTCSVNEDCDDGNPCTDDLCDTGTGDCSNPNKADETPCGINGWCEIGSCFEPECSAAADCNDGNACTVDTCSDYECLFDEDGAAGLGCNDGDDCTTDDECDGFGGCAGTLDDTIPGCAPPSCLPKGASCSIDNDCCGNKCRGGKCR